MDMIEPGLAYPPCMESLLGPTSFNFGALASTICNDCNGNGIPDECERGDMNDDGVVDGSDIQLFVERLLGG